MAARGWILVALGFVVAACGVEDNPAVCEGNAADVDHCAAGLTCVNRACIPIADADAGPRDAPADMSDARGGPDVREADGGGADAQQVDSAPECRNNGDCTNHPRGKLCDTATHTCVACLAPADCSGPTPLCSGGVCVACDRAPRTTCTDKSAATPFCDAESGKCLECGTNDECSRPTEPICGSDHHCAPCTTDAQCAGRGDAPAICLIQEGRCARVDETIFLESRVGCAGGALGKGTRAEPFCLVQSALEALAPNKLVISAASKGAVPLDGFVFMRTDLGGPATIVGDGTIQIQKAAPEAVRVSNGELYLRGFRITSQSGTGVVVDGAGTLHMSRCLLQGSGAGGLYVNGGGFDVTNTIIADNRRAGAGFPVEFGGAYLLGINNKAKRFSYNTVVSNEGYGLYCAGADLTAAGLLLYDNGVNRLGCNTLTASKEGMPPQFSTARPFHLTSGSACVNGGEAAGAAGAPMDDIDQQRRPRDARDAMLDCGADELDP